MKMRNLGDLNTLCNFQDIIILFDTNILVPNKDEESKRQDLKIVYSIKNNGKSETKKLSLK